MEWEQSESNPVLFYKLQGQDYMDDEDLNLTRDFIVILQSPFQKTLAQKFAHKGVCCDATHGTTGYDFKLTTLLVIDEFGQGVPVVWCLSNNEDFTHMCVFFKMIKRNCGRLDPQWFMSDIAPQFFNAWVAINSGNRPQHLYCTWHVDKACKEELREKVGDVDTESQIYKMLRTILEQPDEKSFDEHLAIFTHKISQLDKTAEFLKYFEHDWLPKRRNWAYYHRGGLGINMNMFVEAFHRVFKYNYLNGKRNKRVDVCLLQLVKFARDIAFKRAIKLLKHKDSYRVKEIKKRHAQCLEMSLENVIVVDDATWNVKSESYENTYNVSCVSESCQYESCQERCIKCDVCVHQYLCNCTDSLIKHSICKHIHLVRRYNMEKAGKGKQDMKRAREEEVQCELGNITENIKLSGPTAVYAIKERIHQKLLPDQTTLKQLDKSLNSAENLFISLSENKSLNKLKTVNKICIASCLGQRQS
jgi:hypothetical protein